MSFGKLLTYHASRPLSFVSLILFAALTALIAVTVDTNFYTSGELTFSNVLESPVITPLNNFLYNSDSANLAQHGIHPRYQHFLVNLPQLLGPAIALLFFLRPSDFATPNLVSAFSGITLLSIFPHQEARFLLPAVPLILASVRLPRVQVKFWISTWILFNALLGILMGIYHQGGTVPVQMHLAKTNETVSQVFWWKTYSPPTWLLNGKNEKLKTIDLMGMKGDKMIAKIDEALPACPSHESLKAEKGDVYLVAPRSAYFLLPYRTTQKGVSLEEIWSYRQHLNLDDMDFAEDGFMETVKRVVGDRGLVVYKATRSC